MGDYNDTVRKNHISDNLQVSIQHETFIIKGLRGVTGSIATAFCALLVFPTTQLPNGAALDEVRRGEYQRLKGKDRSFIKGQCYTLLGAIRHLGTKKEGVVN